MNKLIVEIDNQRCLAKNGRQPWSIPADEKYFTAMTKADEGIVLVGKTTFRTFRTPLVERKNYVLTHDRAPIKGASLVHDMDDFLDEFHDKVVWVVGGAKIYQAVMQAGKADELYITHIDADLDCDQFFPDYKANYKLIDKSEMHEQNGFRFYFARYVHN